MDHAVKGSDFCRGIAHLQRFPQREHAVVQAAISGAMLPVALADVVVWAGGKTAAFRVATDVFAIGEPDDFVRIPLSPLAASVLCEAFGFSMITRRIADATWMAAKTAGGVVLDPQPMSPAQGFPYDSSMLTVDRFVLHNAWIEKSRRGRQGLVVGHKKDVVLTNRLATEPDRVAIYGWHAASGNAIQPLSLAHESTYADYSHGIRFMEPLVAVGGEPEPLTLPELADKYPELLMDQDKLEHPEVLRVFEQPGSFPDWSGIRPDADTEPAPAATVSEGALAAALEDLDKGIHEIPLGSNSGPVIDDYLRAVGVGPHNEWCAAACSAWLRQGAERAGKDLPVKGSAGALALGQQLAVAAKSGAVTWKTKPRLEDLAPGSVVVWERPEAGPGKGHIALVHSTGREHFWTVEGNVGDWVAMREHRLDDPHLVGAAVLL
jgi:hypothetical protein